MNGMKCEAQEAKKPRACAEVQKERRHLPRLAMLLVGHEIMPLELVVERGSGEAEYDLAEEVVGTVSPVIPDGDLERALPQLGPPDTAVDEGLVPSRLVRVR